MARDWLEVRAEANLNEEAVAAQRDRMLDEVRAARLAELRTRQELTQMQVAERMHVSQARVSAIENGEVTATEVATLRRYIAALGGHLEVVADFDGERLVLG